MSNSNNNQRINEKSSTKLITKITGSIKYTTQSFGAVLALPLMIFNGLTTVSGAAKILPVGIGIPVGTMLSIIYFLVVVLQRIKRKHPLRRFLLVLILSLGSTYTSFFAIYDQLTEDQLKYYSVNTTVNAHNKFINNIRTSLDREINSLEIKDLQIEEFNSLNQKLDILRDKRDKVQDQDLKGEIAEQVERIKERLKELAVVEASSQYQIHSKLSKLKADKKDQLTNRLSIEEFIDLKQSASELFADDSSLYEDIIINLENIDGVNVNELKQQVINSLNYDNYLKTPAFLVPIEVALNPETRRQFNFVVFALIVSIFLEFIPLLLGGIHININRKAEVDNENSLKHSPKNTNKKNRSKSESKKTIINELSEVISVLIQDIKEMRVKLFESVKKPIKIKENIKKFHKAILAAQLTDENKYDFLIKFYQNIDPEKRIISMSKFSDEKLSEEKLSEENSRFRIAACLLIDVMRDSRVGWLNKPLVSFTLRLPGQNTGEWHFDNETKYQEFLDWWLDEMNNDSEELEDHLEEVVANAELDVGYEHSHSE